MPCDQCQAISQDGVRCERRASCHQGCYEFCWQHAKMYREGRAQGEWQKGKGCTGKKLYQYRKKSGPQTGTCSSKTMIGASGNCVARTPANLARKKESLANRKLKGKKKSSKKKSSKKKSSKKKSSKKKSSKKKSSKKESIEKDIAGFFGIDFDPGNCLPDEFWDAAVRKCRKKGEEESSLLEEVIEILEESPSEEEKADAVQEGIDEIAKGKGSQDQWKEFDQELSCMKRDGTWNRVAKICSVPPPLPPRRQPSEFWVDY